MINSTDMALDAIIWLKQTKNCFIHCTEYGYEWRADAIGYNGKDMIEIEVKTSWSDFNADFKNKKKKHQVLLDALNGKTKTGRYNYIPNYLYYLVTPSLKDRALKYLKDNNLPYGLMTYNISKDQRRSAELISIKKVKRIHKLKIRPHELRTMMARMSNEYIYGFVDMKRKLKYEIEATIDNIFQGVGDKSFEITNDSINKIWDGAKEEQEASLNKTH